MITLAMLSGVATNAATPAKPSGEAGGQDVPSMAAGDSGDVHGEYTPLSSCEESTRPAMGSNDPHRLGLNERGWRPPMRTPTYDVLLGHDEAEAGELIGRRFAPMNVAPRTAPLPPPEPQPSSPPSITRLDEAIKPSVIRRVKLWLRAWERCRHFAERGNLRQAKKVRPPDLWISADDSMQPAALPWNWDLRPLMRGEPAVPWATSGVDGIEPPTSLDLVAFREAQQEAGGESGFTDEAILSEVVSGVNDDVGGERGTLLCAPHVSALVSWDVASERTARNVSKKWAFEAELPCWPIRACPYGVVDESSRAGEPKWRLTNDLSWPPPFTLPDGGGGFVKSHNEAMDRSGWPPNAMMLVKSLGEAAAIMQLSGAPVEAWSADCDSYYRTMGRQRAQIWRNAMAVAGGFQVDERCCFGSAADATKCSRITNFIIHEARRAMAEVDARYPSIDPRIQAWQRRRREALDASTEASTGEHADALGAAGGYIDDLSGVSFADECVSADGQPLLRAGTPVRRSTLHFEALVRTLERYGYTSKPSKEQPPGGSIEVLGVKLDLAMGRMTLLEKKRRRYAKCISEALMHESMAYSEYLKLMGRLQSASQCFPRGKLWLSAAWRVGRARFRLSSGRVLLTRKVRGELERWRAELSRAEHSGVPLASRAAIRSCGEPGAGAIYADASGEIGWCAWTVAGEELLTVSGEWSEAERAGLIIAEKELFASTVGVIALAQATGMSDAWSFTDNTVALSAMRSMTPSTPRMQELAAARVEWMVEHGVREAAERISTKANLWADWGSRGKLMDVERQAQQMGLRVRRVEPPPEWRSAAFLLRVEA